MTKRSGRNNDRISSAIHCGDAIEHLGTLPDQCAHLIIADPPYNLGPTFGTVFERNIEEWLPWCKAWLDDCSRILHEEGNIFVYGIHHYLCFLQVYMYEIGLKYRRQVIWHYENGFSSYNRSLAAHYEPILWFSKGDSYRFSPIREPYKSSDRLKHRIIKNGKVWTPHPEGRIAGDVWRFPTLAGRRFRNEKVDHPTQKPLALTDRIVEHFSMPGDLVVVPFAGSGTECVSANRLGRRYWAVEINPDYVALALRRLEAPGTVEQTSLLAKQT